MLTLMDRATLPHEKSPLPHCKPTLRAILKHIATQTITCRLLTHTYTVRPKLHLVDLLSTYYKSKFATNTQEIELMELEP